MEKLVQTLLTELGEDTTREGLQKTPERVAKSLRFMTSGYRQNVDDVINNAIFEEDHDEMVICRDIDFYSMCEHHMLPFFGRCHIAYVPNGKVIGLSKLGRIVDVFARRLQLQERLNRQVAEVINDRLDPQGVAVVMEATHLCMVMRGVQKQNSMTVTSCMLGVFEEQHRTRQEFMNLIGIARP
jgi:GTP cyclohydrolase I